jgi:quinoprotein glucose dehydrogenase
MKYFETAHNLQLPYMKKFPKTTCVVIALLLVIISIYCNTGAASSGYDHTTWKRYGGGADQSKFFDASQVTKENVGKMEVAWVYPTGDSIGYFFSPIVVDTIMYVLGKNFSLVAINAITGREIWIHARLNGISRRGITYWESKDKKDSRLLFTLGNSLQAIDARTGKSVTSFGANGYVDLREGLDRDPSSIRRVQSMMPGFVFEDLVILGSSPGENYFSPPGYVRAYNVVTGKLVWTFHTIPRPGEYGYDTWPKDAYKYVGAANVWGEIAIDEKRGIAYLPLGSPTYDYYGADREGSNLFGNCLVAVDARTGKRLWHFQTVHHDLWDYDLSAAPQLITVNRNGKKIDAVAVATKHGFLFVFDRVSGEPVWPIEEKPFPASEMPGEKSWPTQPVPAVIPSFARHEVTKETINPYFSKEEKEKWERRIDSAKTGLFMPPSDKYETMIIPGAVGGTNFGNTASDPGRGLVFIQSQDFPSVYKLGKVKSPQQTLSPDDVKKVMSVYTNSCQSCHGENMAGGVGPSLVNAGQRLSFDEFTGILVGGRGQMPGFPHIDEPTTRSMYRYLGGIPGRSFARRGDSSKLPEGPVVASGGARIVPDAKRNPVMSDYPVGVAHPQDRYTSDYGLSWANLLSPPWSWIVAYDLNTGTIKWKQPLGEDSVAVSNGNKHAGAPNGSQRKGMVITSTGIVFSTGRGGKLYAFDADNGNILWETNLGYDTNAQPTMFQINGRQYLVINATASFSAGSFDRSKLPGALPRGYVVYALPD